MPERRSKLLYVRMALQVVEWWFGAFTAFGSLVISSEGNADDIVYGQLATATFFAWLILSGTHVLTLFYVFTPVTFFTATMECIIQAVLAAIWFVSGLYDVLVYPDIPLGLVMSLLSTASSVASFYDAKSGSSTDNDSAAVATATVDPEV